MQEIKIIGSAQPLEGTIVVSGAKNSALPILCASILMQGESTVTNIPDLVDIKNLCNLLESLGMKISTSGSSDIENGSKNRKLTLDASSINNYVAEYELVSKMRASVLVLGPLLAKYGYAKVSMPGGCAIGTRPIDMHIYAMEELGATVTLENGYVIAEAKKLKGAEIFFDKVSVGATENAITAAVLAEGKTIIHNAAREPEISDLCNYLISAGAKITGQGTDVIVIEGVEKLNALKEHAVISDRIEAGTYAVAAFITKGKIKIANINPELLRSQLHILQKMGASITEQDNFFEISSNTRPKAVDIRTDPYPNLPTDLQAQMMALLGIADGTSLVHETLFENRFMHVSELNRMGAHITVDGNTAVVKGIENYTPATVMATDLRASVALILAGLVANGETVVKRIYHLQRGYENLVQKLSACGAKIFINESE